MKKIKEAIDAAAVLVANLLKFQPTNWKQSQSQAQTLRETKAKAGDKGTFFGTVQDKDGSTVEFVKAVSPIGYLADSLLNWVVAGVALYAAYKLALFLGQIAVGLAILMAIGWVITKLVTWKDKAPADQPTAA